jgi:hypothetical protein
MAYLFKCYLSLSTNFLLLKYKEKEVELEERAFRLLNSADGHLQAFEYANKLV